jgi:hypothetical protein
MLTVHTAGACTPVRGALAPRLVQPPPTGRVAILRGSSAPLPRKRAATKLPRRAVTGLGSCMEESEFPWHRLPSNRERAVNARLPATTGPTATPSASP